jgi:predicted dehydrogenase
MRKWDEITEIYLEKATVKIKTPPPTSKQSGAEVEIYSENGIIQQNRILEDNNQWAFMNQAEAFAEAVKNGETSTKYVEESIKDIDMMEQIYKMENSGEQK